MNMADNEGSPLIAVTEFRALPREEQIVLMKKWRAAYKNDEIVSGLGISPAAFYALLHDLNIPTRGRSSKGGSSDEPETSSSDETPSVRRQVTDTNTFSFRYSGTATGGEIARRLSLVAGDLDGDATRFKVQVIIENSRNGS